MNMKVKVKLLRCVRLFATLWTVAHIRPWDSPGKNTNMACHFLLQGIFLTQGLNTGLLHCCQVIKSVYLGGWQERLDRQK